MMQQGFLLIADITGYTMFLTRSELEHAQGILDALFKSIFAEIKAPIILSNLQGDAALTYLPDVKLPQRQFPLDAIERIYCSFANTLGAMRLNTTCTCNACRNMNQLDLKFFLHHGAFATQEMAGRTELQGAEVIRLHRLMKNSVTAATGIKAYALVTEQDMAAWRPFDYVTWHIRLPMGAIVRQMAELTPLENGGTHLSLRCAKPEGPNPVATALVRTITRLAMAKKLIADQRASKAALERMVAEEGLALAATGTAA